MKITGKATIKPYKCSSCGHTEKHSTNHYGEIYIRCVQCSWKSPLDPIKVFVCEEKLPKGWAKPEPWKKVKLDDICTIVEGKNVTSQNNRQ